MELFARKLRIVDLKVHEFMGVEGELFIDFSDTTEIIGDNGKGKTLILNAIAFLFCGTDAFGKKVDFSVYGTKEVFSYVEANVLKDGEEVLFKRTYKVNKKGSKSMTFSENHLKIKQNEWGRICDRDVFLSMINPKYLSSLKSSNLRDVLIKFMKIKGIDSKGTLMSLDIEDIIILEDELYDSGDIDEVESEYSTNLKNTNSLIKVKTQKLEEFKELEEPKQVNEKYVIDAKFFDTEEEAFEYALEKIIIDPSDENINVMKEFNEIKASKAIQNQKIVEYQNNVKNIPKIEKEIEKLIEEKENLEKLLKAVNNFNEKIIENLNLDKSIDGFQIQFENIYGKSDFKIIYKDAPIDTCSYSEQIICGVKLTDYFMEQLSLDFPMFIDNAECITTFPKLREPRQLISMSVAKDFELSKYVGDKIVNLRTLETMPKVNKESLVVTRLLGGRFELAK